MRRALWLGLLLAVVLAPPAGAQMSPGPTVVDFEDVAQTTTNPTVGGATFSGECFTVVWATGGEGDGHYLDTGCTSPAFIDFASEQAIVSLRYRVDHADPPRPLTYVVYDSQLPFPMEIDRRTITPAATGQWLSLVVSEPNGLARIGRFEFTYTPPIGGGEEFRLDNVGFSPDPRQPDTEIFSGPTGTVTTGDAAFGFRANQDRVTFTCQLDGGVAEPCASGKSYAGLADGSHTFTVAATDLWGTADATPATRTWTVQRPVPPRADRDRDGVLDATDNCPDKANSGQGDGDRDGIGDACELLPSGNTPLVAGQFAKVELVSGEVFVKLPRGAAASAFTAGLRAPFQESGFLPLKGVAAVPMGSTLDTRSGEVALTAAVNGRPAGDPRQLRRVARFRAGIFAIRQARALKGSVRAKRIPPRAELTSAPGAETPCARSAASGPPKGIRVRSLAMTAKGVFRTVGGAAIATPAKGTATYIATDRCDGTLTEVGRGRVAVIAKSSGKRRVVPAGRAFIVKARLFAAKKGRRNPG